MRVGENISGLICHQRSQLSWPRQTPAPLGPVRPDIHFEIICWSQPMSMCHPVNQWRHRRLACVRSSPPWHPHFVVWSDSTVIWDWSPRLILKISIFIHTPSKLHYETNPDIRCRTTMKNRYVCIRVCRIRFIAKPPRTKIFVHSLIGNQFDVNTQKMQEHR